MVVILLARGDHPRAVVAAARARAGGRAGRADPLAGARRGGRAPARLGAADAGAGAEAGRRPARGGRARPPAGARAARVAQRRRGPPGTFAARARGGGLRGRGRPPRADRGRDGGRRAARRRAAALVAAAREALVNASKFAGPEPIALYAEVEDGRFEVFVRDRGPGFDPEAVPADRRGVRESIVGRMERHGGRAIVHSRPGEGTEVELVLGMTSVVIVDDHQLFRAGVRAELDGLVDVLGDAATVEDAVRTDRRARARRRAARRAHAGRRRGRGDPPVRAARPALPRAVGVRRARGRDRDHPRRRPRLRDQDDLRRGAGRRGAPGGRRRRGVLAAAGRLRARRVRRRSRPAEVDPELDQLTAREREVLRHIARGYLYKEIARGSGSRPRRSRRTCPPCCASCSSPPATSSRAGRCSGGWSTDGLTALPEEIAAHAGCGFEPCETATRWCPARATRPRTCCSSARRRGPRRTSWGARSSAAPGKLLDEVLAAAGLERGGRVDHQRGQGAPAGQPRPHAPAEVAHCLPWLERELELIAPRVVVPLGRHALAHFAPAGEDQRGPRPAAADRGARVLYPLYHPAAALRAARCGRRCSPTPAGCRGLPLA